MKKIHTLTINGQAYTLEDPTAARIDDGTVGSDAWSGKQIIDRLCPAFTQSGAAVTCTPVQGYPLGVVSHIKPVQEGAGDPRPEMWKDVSAMITYPIDDRAYAAQLTIGETYQITAHSDAVLTGITVDIVETGESVSGTFEGDTFQFAMPLSAPSPDGNSCEVSIYAHAEEETFSASFTMRQLFPGNVRPITGFDSVKLWRGGKNLLPYPYVDKTVTRSGITFTDNGDGTITANGTATSAASFVLTEALPATEAFGRLIMSGCPAGGSVATYSITNVQTGHKDTGSGYTFRCDKNHKRWRITIGAGTTVSNLVFKPQIELGTVATSYEPYRGHTFTAQLGQTVYGGSLNWQTGVLTVDRRIYTMTGEETYTIFQTHFIIYVPSELAPLGNDGLVDGICSHGVYGGYLNGKWCVNGSAIIYTPAGDYTLDEAGMASHKAFVKAQYAAGTPVQLVYKAEPTTVQLDPTQIHALSGINTLYSSTGDTEVSGRADLITLLQALTEKA